MAQDPNNPNPAPANTPPANTPPATPPNGDNKGDEKQPVPYERFSEVNAKARELEKWKQEREKADAEAEQKRLEEQGKHKELADKALKERDEATAKYSNYVKVSELKVAALQAGCVDPDALAKIVDLAQVKVNDDGTVDNAALTALIEKIKTEKAYLFGAAQTPANVGSKGGAPNTPTGQKPTFTRTQLRDAKFFDEHKAEIMEAMREGRITD